MLFLDLHASYGFPYSLQVRNVVNGIKFLHILWLDVGKAKRLEALRSEFGIVPEIGKELLPHRACGTHQVADLAIEWITCQTLAKDSAKKVLFIQRCKHKCRRNRTCVIDQVHLR